MKDELPQFADNTLRAGWLQLMWADTGFDVNFRVAGSVFKYQCSDGFELPSKTNPEQSLVCQGSRSVDTSSVIDCVRKLSLLLSHSSLFHLAMVCDVSQPDTGASAGVASYSWDFLNLYRTNITLTCPFGQAFDDNYTMELVNTCDYQSYDATQLDWTYNANNPLPNCIRKCLIIVCTNL